MWGLKGQERKIKNIVLSFIHYVYLFSIKNTTKKANLKASYFIRFSILVANQFWVCVT